MTNFYPKPKKCIVCSHHFSKEVGTRMYDAVLLGRWGCICHICFRHFNCTLGIGRGQKYERQTDGQFLLVEGGRQ